MTASRLREAADLLRMTAEAATPGPWVHCYTASNRHWVEGPGDHNGYDDTIATGMPAADATYIAMMSPPVALALADWLDYAVRIVAWSERPGAGPIDPRWPALAVADAILGTPAKDAAAEGEGSDA